MTETEERIYGILDDAILVLFVIEAIMKMIAYGLQDYFKSGWNKYLLCAFFFA
jgi:uncharacterized membrane protein YkvA (DUF1232 family)